MAKKFSKVASEPNVSDIKALRDRVEKVAHANRQNQEAYRDRRRQSGQVRVSVWVPQHRADELRRIAHAMCLEKPRKKSAYGAPIVGVSGETPSWSYLKVAADEVWLQMILKANKAQWQNANKKHPNTWRVRTDLVKELGLTKRVVAEEGQADKKPTGPKKRSTSRKRSKA